MGPGGAYRYTLQPVFTSKRHRCHIRHFTQPPAIIYELFIYAQVLLT